MKAVAGANAMDRSKFEVAEVLADGRTVLRVPKSRWFLHDWPELEVECKVCGEQIRWSEFVMSESRDGFQSAVKRQIPKVHSGHCSHRVQNLRTATKAAKEHIKRRDGVKHVSQKRLQVELEKIMPKVKFNKFDAALSKLMSSR